MTPIVAQLVSSAGGFNYVGLILSGTALISFAPIVYSGQSSEPTPPTLPEPVAVA
ncbi:MAG TPA: hypothetical protein VE820_14815 [Sphingomicrobium sp.]|nr:hypothetical protein [Sphingomicrobium sp.]